MRLSVATVIDPRLAGGPDVRWWRSTAIFDGSAYVATRLDAVDSLRHRPTASAGRCRHSTPPRGASESAPSCSAYDSATGVPASLANGQFVRVLVRTTTVGGAWVVTGLPQRPGRGGRRARCPARGADHRLHLGRVVQHQWSAGRRQRGDASPGWRSACGWRPKARCAAGCCGRRSSKIESEDQVKADGVDLRGHDRAHRPQCANVFVRARQRGQLCRRPASATTTAARPTWRCGRLGGGARHLVARPHGGRGEPHQVRLTRRVCRCAAPPVRRPLTPCQV